LNVTTVLLVGGVEGETCLAAVGDSLPTDLEKAVEEDNQTFAQEIVDWDNEQKKKSLQQQQQQQQSDPDLILVADHRPGKQKLSLQLMLYGQHASTF
jgi:hypothetical protein